MQDRLSFNLVVVIDVELVDCLVYLVLLVVLDDAQVTEGHNQVASEDQVAARWCLHKSMSPSRAVLELLEV